MKKRIFKTLFLVVSSLCVIFASQAVLADNENGYDYTISSGEATITAFPGYRGEKNVVIPDTLGGCPVVAIESISRSLDPVQTLVIPNTVTYIGDNCFYSWSHLEQITWPENLTHIGDNAFYRMGRVTSIELPNSVEHIGTLAFSESYCVTDILIGENVEFIGDGAFSGCSTIENISVDSKNNNFVISDGSLYSAEKDRILLYPTASQSTSFAIEPTVKTIGHGAFWCASFLREISIPESVSAIGANAFWSCSALESIDIPNKVTRIEDGTFNFCESLKSVSLPDSVTYIGEYAFAVCKSLEEIKLPSSLETLGNWVFSDCIAMKELVIPDGIKNIPACIVSYGGVKDLYIPATVTTMDMYSFFFSPVTDIYYTGTMEEWNEIEGVTDAVELGYDITVHFNHNPIAAHTHLSVTSDGTEHTVKISKKNFDNSANAIVVGYNSGKTAQITVESFSGDTVTATLTGIMDTFKSITVESLGNLKPLCASEIKKITN